MNQLIIFSVLLAIILILAFVGTIGAKNAKENKFRLTIPLYHTDIFKFEDKVAIKFNKLLIDALNEPKEIDSVTIQVNFKEPKNEF